MHRIDNITAVPQLPLVGPPINPGFFTDGNPAAAFEATVVDAWWLNQLQEEILTVTAAAGMTPNKSNHGQLFEALQLLFLNAGEDPGAGRYLPLLGGTLSGPGNLTVNGALTAAGAAPQITLNATVANWIEWRNLGTGGPTLNDRSPGTKLVLYPQLSATNADFAIGIATGTLWQSLPTAAGSSRFAWYGGSTEIAFLTGAGNLTITGALTIGSGSTSGFSVAGTLTGSYLTVPQLATLGALTVNGDTNLHNVGAQNIDMNSGYSHGTFGVAGTLSVNGDSNLQNVNMNYGYSAGELRAGGGIWSGWDLVGCYRRKRDTSVWKSLMAAPLAVLTSTPSASATWLMVTIPIALLSRGTAASASGLTGISTVTFKPIPVTSAASSISCQRPKTRSPRCGRSNSSNMSGATCSIPRQLRGMTMSALLPSRCARRSPRR
jgi:hypothetical protein